jgi:hypothetical protein
MTDSSSLRCTAFLADTVLVVVESLKIQTMINILNNDHQRPPMIKSSGSFPPTTTTRTRFLCSYHRAATVADELATAHCVGWPSVNAFRRYVLVHSYCDLYISILCSTYFSLRQCVFQVGYSGCEHQRHVASYVNQNISKLKPSLKRRYK